MSLCSGSINQLSRPSGHANCGRRRDQVEVGARVLPSDVWMEAAYARRIPENEEECEKSRLATMSSEMNDGCFM